MLKNQIRLGISLIFVLITMNANADQKVTVFAAASLTNAINEIAANY
jgi:molybdate transport system substrate-binding protein